MKHLLRRVAAVASAVAVLSAASGSAIAQPIAQPTAPAAHSAMFRRPALLPHYTPRITPPTPTTPEGFAAAFNNVDLCQWGSADGGEEVTLSGGRHAWFFGDTWRSCWNPEVHSSEITQVGTTMHVSDGGAQVLPNDPIVNGRQDIYWIETATSCATVANPNCVKLLAAEINIDPTGQTPGWENPYPTTDRVAYVNVSAAGDTTFVGWAGYVPKPNIPTTMYTIDSQPGHYGYDRRCHKDLHLADGGYLVTESQGWSSWQIDPATGAPAWWDYRNLFYSSRQISGCTD